MIEIEIKRIYDLQGRQLTKKSELLDVDSFIARGLDGKLYQYIKGKITIIPKPPKTPIADSNEKE